MAKLSGNWITRVMRLAIYMRDRFTCVYCCKPMFDAAPFDITLDHIKPRNAGGKHTPRNLVTACRSCNSSKKDRRDWMNKRQQKRVERQIAKPLPLLAAERIIFGD